MRLLEGTAGVWQSLQVRPKHLQQLTDEFGPEACAWRRRGRTHRVGNRLEHSNQLAGHHAQGYAHSEAVRVYRVKTAFRHPVAGPSGLRHAASSTVYY